MAKFYFLSLLSMFANLVYSQDIFEIRGAYTRPIKMASLENAKTMMDLSPGFPRSWISQYHSSEITVMNKGEKFSGLGINDTLSIAQKNYLLKAEMGSDIAINVIYSSLNPLTNESNLNSISFSLTLIPEKEAEPVVGYEGLKSFIKEKIKQNKKFEDLTQLEFAFVRFTVDANGLPTNSIISQSSGNVFFDASLLEIIQKMPKWNAAENVSGQKINQVFEFRIGKNVGC